MKTFLLIFIFSLSLKSEFLIISNDPYTNSEIQHCAIAYFGKYTTNGKVYNHFQIFDTQGSTIFNHYYIDSLTDTVEKNYIKKVFSNYRFNQITYQCEKIFNSTDDDVTQSIVSYPVSEIPVGLQNNDLDVVYKYGLTFTQFNFLSGLTGLLTAVLLVFVIYKKV